MDKSNTFSKRHFEKILAAYLTGLLSEQRKLKIKELTRTKQVGSDDRINQALREVLNQKLYTGKDALKAPRHADVIPSNTPRNPVSATKSGPP